MGNRVFEQSDEIYDAIDDGEVIEKLNWRHGHKDVIVFAFEAKHWRTTIDVHHEEGRDIIWPIRATEVHRVETKVMQWKDV